MISTRFLSIVLAAGLACGLSGCFKPPANMPDASVIGYDGRNTVPPDCAALAAPSELTDAGWHRPSMQWGCATYTNLAAQIAHPQDIIAPHRLDPADAAVAASAVRRYERGEAVHIDSASVRDAR